MLAGLAVAWGPGRAALSRRLRRDGPGGARAPSWEGSASASDAPPGRHDRQFRIQEPPNGYNAEDPGMKIVAPLINAALGG